MTKTRRIVESILAEIASGKLVGGERIDSERQVAYRFGVSLGTAQAALKELQHLGVIRREHGRGSFVRAPEDAVTDARFVRFYGKDGAELPIHAEIAFVRKVAATGEKKLFFGPANARCVRIARRLDVGGLFSIASDFLLREADFERLSSGSHGGMEGNIREKLATILALPTLRTEQSLSLVRLPKLALDVLHLPDAQQGVRMKMRSFTFQDEPLFLHTIYCVDFAGTDLLLSR